MRLKLNEIEIGLCHFFVLPVRTGSNIYFIDVMEKGRISLFSMYLLLLLLFVSSLHKTIVARLFNIKDSLCELTRDQISDFPPI